MRRRQITTDSQFKDTLSYTCNCTYGITPLIYQYDQTIPAFICHDWKANCVNQTQNNLSALMSCNDYQCGTSSPGADCATSHRSTKTGITLLTSVLTPSRSPATAPAPSTVTVTPGPQYSSPVVTAQEPAGTPSSEAPTLSSVSHDLGAGAKAGIGIGAGVALLLILAALLYGLRTRSRQRKHQSWTQRLSHREEMAMSKQTAPGELSAESAPHVKYAELPPVSVGPELDGHQRFGMDSGRTGELATHGE